MLRLLHIENIAVIEQADILFERGFNVMTGETGDATWGTAVERGAVTVLPSAAPSSSSVPWLPAAQTTAIVGVSCATARSSARPRRA